MSAESVAGVAVFKAPEHPLSEAAFWHFEARYHGWPDEQLDRRLLWLEGERVAIEHVLLRRREAAETTARQRPMWEGGVAD